MSASFAQSVFFGDSDTALGLQTCLFDAIRGLDHPHKGRFGSHFLLFPLLGVNKHFRREAASYLYRNILAGEAPSLLNPKVKERSKLTLQRRIVQRGEWRVDNDPRLLWTWAASFRFATPAIDLYPVSFDPDSLDLEVTYRLESGSTALLSIETTELCSTGEAFSYEPAGFAIASSAAFTHSSEELQKLNQKIRYHRVLGGKTYNRPHTIYLLNDMWDLGIRPGYTDCWGLRSAIPLPQDGGPFKIALSKRLALKRGWPCTRFPGTISVVDKRFRNGYTVSYIAKLHDVQDHMDEMRQLPPEPTLYEGEEEEGAGEEGSPFSAWVRPGHTVADYEMYRRRIAQPEGDTVKNLVALRVQEVRAPLMHLLRPPIDKYEVLRKF